MIGCLLSSHQAAGGAAARSTATCRIVGISTSEWNGQAGLGRTFRSLVFTGMIPDARLAPGRCPPEFPSPPMSVGGELIVPKLETSMSRSPRCLKLVRALRCAALSLRPRCDHPATDHPATDCAATDCAATGLHDHWSRDRSPTRSGVVLRNNSRLDRLESLVLLSPRVGAGCLRVLGRGLRVTILEQLFGRATPCCALTGLAPQHS